MADRVRHADEYAKSFSLSEELRQDKRKAEHFLAFLRRSEKDLSKKTLLQVAVKGAPERTVFQNAVGSVERCECGFPLKVERPDAYFDYVCCTNLLACRDIDAALTEIDRILSPGGYAFLGLTRKLQSFVGSNLVSVDWLYEFGEDKDTPIPGLDNYSMIELVDRERREVRERPSNKDPFGIREHIHSVFELVLRKDSHRVRSSEDVMRTVEELVRSTDDARNAAEIERRFCFLTRGRGCQKFQECIEDWQATRIQPQGELLRQSRAGRDLDDRPPRCLKGPESAACAGTIRDLAVRQVPGVHDGLGVLGARPCDFLNCITPELESAVAEMAQGELCPYRYRVTRSESGSVERHENPLRFLQCFLTRREFRSFQRDLGMCLPSFAYVEPDVRKIHHLQKNQNPDVRVYFELLGLNPVPDVTPTGVDADSYFHACLFQEIRQTQRAGTTETAFLPDFVEPFRPQSESWMRTALERAENIMYCPEGEVATCILAWRLLKVACNGDAAGAFQRVSEWIKACQVALPMAVGEDERQTGQAVLSRLCTTDGGPDENTCGRFREYTERIGLWKCDDSHRILPTLERDFESELTVMGLVASEVGDGRRAARITTRLYRLLDWVLGLLHEPGGETNHAFDLTDAKGERIPRPLLAMPNHELWMAERRKDIERLEMRVARFESGYSGIRDRTKFLEEVAFLWEILYRGLDGKSPADKLSFLHKKSRFVLLPYFASRAEQSAARAHVVIPLLRSRVLAGQDTLPYVGYCLLSVADQNIAGLAPTTHQTRARIRGIVRLMNVLAAPLSDTVFYGNIYAQAQLRTARVITDLQHTMLRYEIPALVSAERFGTKTKEGSDLSLYLQKFLQNKGVFLDNLARDKRPGPDERESFDVARELARFADSGLLVRTTKLCGPGKPFVAPKKDADGSIPREVWEENLSRWRGLFCLRCQNESPCFIFGDIGAFQTILENLVYNSLNSGFYEGSPGDFKVLISAGKEDPYCVVTYTDTGLGFFHDEKLTDMRLNEAQLKVADWMAHGPESRSGSQGHGLWMIQQAVRHLRKGTVNLILGQRRRIQDVTVGFDYGFQIRAQMLNDERE